MGEDEGYTTWLPLKVADAVELAIKRMQPARAGFASVMEDRISVLSALADEGWDGADESGFEQS